MKKILIVEDDRFLANAYKAAFDSSSYEVLQAFDGVEALSMVQKEHPAVVILDLLLPNKDGFAVLEEMKADETLKNIPVIIASNLGQQSDIDRGKKLGATDYIVKSETSISDVVRKTESLL